MFFCFFCYLLLLQVNFVKEGCGSDHVCRSNLKMEYKLYYKPNNQEKYTELLPMWVLSFELKWRCVRQGQIHGSNLDQILTLTINQNDSVLPVQHITRLYQPEVKVKICYCEAILYGALCLLDAQEGNSWIQCSCIWNQQTIFFPWSEAFFFFVSAVRKTSPCFTWTTRRKTWLFGWGSTTWTETTLTRRS